MTEMVERIVLFALVAAAACTSPGPSAGPAAVPAGPVAVAPQCLPPAETVQPPVTTEPADGPSVPVVAAWEQVTGPGQGGMGTVVVRLRIERRTRWPLPINIQVVVPAGVRVLRGQTQQRLDASEEPGVTHFEYELAVDAVPQDDLVAIVDSQGESGGVHAEPRYGFGRPEAEAAGIERSGPRARVGGHDLGPGVVLE
jgi:hypothetical protein